MRWNKSSYQNHLFFIFPDRFLFNFSDSVQNHQELEKKLLALLIKWSSELFFEFINIQKKSFIHIFYDDQTHSKKEIQNIFFPFKKIKLHKKSILPEEQIIHKISTDLKKSSIILFNPLSLAVNLELLDLIAKYPEDCIINNDDNKTILIKLNSTENYDLSKCTLLETLPGIEKLNSISDTILYYQKKNKMFEKKTVELITIINELLK